MKDLILAIAIVFLVGCSSTPRVNSLTKIYTGGIPAEQTPYRFSQEPVKREIADEGPEYRRHVRKMQKMRLEHEETLAAIEQIAEENLLARSKGISVPTATLPQPAPSQVAPTAQPANRPRRGYYPQVLGGNAMNSGTYPIIAANGSGPQQVGGGFVTGTVRPVRSGALNKFQSWLTQSQSSPGLRHTGGVPATSTTTYSGSAVVAGTGGITSGLAYPSR